MTATKQEINTRAQALLRTTTDPDEQHGIEVLAAALLGNTWTVVYSQIINQVAQALMDASDNPGFRRGVALLANATGDGSVPVPQRVRNMYPVTVHDLQQQITHLSHQLHALSSPTPHDNVIILNRYGEIETR